MTQSLTSVAQLFGNDEQALARFREMLSADDQQALDALFDSSQGNNLAAAKTAQPLPVELLLLIMIMEQQKTILFLIGRLNYYDQKLYFKRVKGQQPGQV